MLKVNLLGRLGRDAGIYETANGNKFVAFTLAVNTKNLGKDVTYWVDVRSFNQNHIKLVKYLTKGKLLQVGGDYNCNITTDKIGVARISHNVNADYIAFMNLSSPNKSEENATTSAATPNDEPQTHVAAANIEDTIVMNSPTPTPELVPVPVGVATSDASDDLPF